MHAWDLIREDGGPSLHKESHVSWLIPDGAITGFRDCEDDRIDMYITAIVETGKLSEGTHLLIQSPLITDNGRAVIMAAFPVLLQSSTLPFRQ